MPLSKAVQQFKDHIKYSGYISRWVTGRCQILINVTGAPPIIHYPMQLSAFIVLL